MRARCSAIVVRRVTRVMASCPGRSSAVARRPCQDPCMHVLDNPVWHALTGPHATLAERAGTRPVRPDVAVFGAIADDPQPAAWEALARDRRPGRPRSSCAASSGPAVDRGARGPVPADVASPARCADAEAIEPGTRDPRLGAADVPEMLALVERTRPGTVPAAHGRARHLPRRCATPAP